MVAVTATEPEIQPEADEIRQRLEEDVRVDHPRADWDADWEDHSGSRDAIVATPEPYFGVFLALTAMSWSVLKSPS